MCMGLLTQTYECVDAIRKQFCCCFILSSIPEDEAPVTLVLQFFITSPSCPAFKYFMHLNKALISLEVAIGTYAKRHAGCMLKVDYTYS